MLVYRSTLECARTQGSGAKSHAKPIVGIQKKTNKMRSCWVYCRTKEQCHEKVCTPSRILDLCFKYELRNALEFSSGRSHSNKIC